MLTIVNDPLIVLGLCRLRLVSHCRMGFRPVFCISTTCKKVFLVCVLALATPKQQVDERRHFNVRVILNYAVCPAMLPGVGCSVVLIGLTCNSKICSCPAMLPGAGVLWC